MCQNVSEGMKRCLDNNLLSWGVRRCLQASKSANVCQKVSEGMKRCLDNCRGVSGDVYRHPRVPTCVKKCQKV